MKQHESKIIFKKISNNLSKDAFFKTQTVVDSNTKITRTLFLNVLAILFKKLLDLFQKAPATNAKMLDSRKTPRHVLRNKRECGTHRSMVDSYL